MSSQQYEFDEFFSPGAIKQVDDITAKLDVMVDKCIKIADAAVKMNQSFGGKGSSDTVKERVKEIDDLTKANNALERANSDLAAEITKVREQVKAQNTELRLNAQIANSAEGSYNKLDAQLKKLRLEMKKLTQDELDNTEVGKKMTAQAQEMDKVLKEMDATMGVHNRHVGNYKGQLSELTEEIKKVTAQYAALSAQEKQSPYGMAMKTKLDEMAYTVRGFSSSMTTHLTATKQYGTAVYSLSQIFREMPAFTYSAQMGLLAIGNNLPIFADQWKRTAESVDLATGKVNGNAGAMRVFARSIFSWVNILTIVIGLLTVFGDEIFKAFTNTKQLNPELEALNKSIGEQTGKFESLTRQLNNQNLSKREHIRAAKELKELYPTALKNYSAEEIAAGKAAGAIRQIKDALIAVAMARAAQKDIDEKAGKIYENEKKIAYLKYQQIQQLKEEESLRKMLDSKDYGTLASERYAERLFAISKNMTATKDAIGALVMENTELEKSLDDLSVKMAKFDNQANAGGMNGDGTDLSTGNKSAKNKSTDRIAALKEAYEMEVKERRLQFSQQYKTEEEWQIELLQINHKYATKKLDEVKNLSAEELKTRTDFHDDLLKSTEEVVDKQAKALNKQTQHEINEHNRALKARIKDNAEKVKNEQDAWDAIERAWRKAVKDQAKESGQKAVKEKEEQEKIFASRMALRQAELSFVSEMADSIYEIINSREIKAIDEKADALRRYHDDEMRFIEESGMSQKQKAQEKKRLDAEVRAREKQIERDRVTQARKMAIFQKWIDLASITASTAVAVMSALGMKPYGPLNIIAAKGAAVTGATQFLKVLLTPIPQYAKGRTGGPAEFAMVNEMGPELVYDPSSGSYHIPNEGKPGPTFLPQGADVLPADLTRKVMAAAYVTLAGNKGVIDDDVFENVVIEKFDQMILEYRLMRRAFADKDFTSTSYNYGGFEQWKLSQRM